MLQVGESVHFACQEAVMVKVEIVENMAMHNCERMHGMLLWIYGGSWSAMMEMRRMRSR